MFRHYLCKASYFYVQKFSAYGQNFTAWRPAYANDLIQTIICCQFLCIQEHVSLTLPKPECSRVLSIFLQVYVTFPLYFKLALPTDVREHLIDSSYGFNTTARKPIILSESLIGFCV